MYSFFFTCSDMLVLVAHQCVNFGFDSFRVGLGLDTLMYGYPVLIVGIDSSGACMVGCLCMIQSLKY